MSQAQEGRSGSELAVDLLKGRLHSANQRCNELMERDSGKSLAASEAHKNPEREFEATREQRA